jgi:hypothetical protein
LNSPEYIPLAQDGRAALDVKPNPLLHIGDKGLTDEDPLTRFEFDLQGHG